MAEPKTVSNRIDARLKTSRCFVTLIIAIYFLCACANCSNLKYQSVVSFSTGASTPNTFAVGDFNGDGKPDIAVPDNYGKTIAVYLNQQGGSFGAPIITTLSIDNTLGAILSGDFNGDGKADIIVAT